MACRLQSAQPSQSQHSLQPSITYSEDHKLLGLPHGMPALKRTALTITTLSTTKHSLISKTMTSRPSARHANSQSAQLPQSQHSLKPSITYSKDHKPLDIRTAYQPQNAYTALTITTLSTTKYHLFRIP